MLRLNHNQCICCVKLDLCQKVCMVLNQMLFAQGDTIRLGTVPPGCSYPLPMKWNQDSWQLQVRPIFGERALHHWCLLVSDGEGDGLDLSNLTEGI